MTLEEKLTYMQTVSMEQARAEGNAIIDAHREALEKIFSDHKSEMMRQAETRIKAETTNAKRTVSHWQSLSWRLNEAREKCSRS